MNWSLSFVYVYTLGKFKINPGIWNHKPVPEPEPGFWKNETEKTGFEIGNGFGIPIDGDHFGFRFNKNHGIMADKHLGDFSCLGIHWLNGSEKHPQHQFANGSLG